jgi:hypothetical protein
MATNHNNTPTATTKRLFTVAHQAWETAKKKHQAALVGFLSCVRHRDSPAQVLQEIPLAVRLIAEFAAFGKPEPVEDDKRRFMGKVHALLCTGGEGVWVERLTVPNAVSLSNMFIGGALMMDAHADWMKDTRVYTFTNADDGTFWNEGQLREHYGNYLREHHYCGAPHMCHGLCYALPGDTLFVDYMGSVSGWRAATQAELEDRGYLGDGPGGLLSQYCQLARDDPSQLFGNGNDDDDDGEEEED